MRYRFSSVVIAVIVVTGIIVFLAWLPGALGNGAKNAPPKGAPQVSTPVAATSPQPAAPQVAIESLPVMPGQTRYAFDSINGEKVPVNAGPDYIVHIARGTPLQVIGWAVDTSQNLPAGGVYLSIDNGLNTSTAYGFDRSDVATSLGMPTLRKVGFSGTIPTDALTPGHHLLVLKILSANSQAYYQPSQSISVDIT
jgi:hypothetical protein